MNRTAFSIISIILIHVGAIILTGNWFAPILLFVSMVAAAGVSIIGIGLLILAYAAMTGGRTAVLALRNAGTTTHYMSTLPASITQLVIAVGAYAVFADLFSPGLGLYIVLCFVLGKSLRVVLFGIDSIRWSAPPHPGDPK